MKKLIAFLLAGVMLLSLAACAAAVAAAENGYCKKGAKIRLLLRGGELEIVYTDDAVFMTGGAQKVFEAKSRSRRLV